MLNLHTEKLNRAQKVCAFSGIGLIILSVVLLLSTFSGVLELQSFAILGHSGVRTLASIAIAGCLLAAIGYYDE